MPKPDYAYWDAQPKYNLPHAAFLCCDLEPERITKDCPMPPRVGAMLNRLMEEVEHSPDSETEVIQGVFQSYTRTRPVLPYAQREDLRQWAERTGQRGAMPFLFPEDRDTGEEDLGTESLRTDTKEGYLFLIGLMAHTIAEMSGPAMKNPKGDPNLAALLEKLNKTARTLKVSIEKGDGFTKTPFNNKVSAALEEVRNRQRGWPLSP